MPETEYKIIDPEITHEIKDHPKVKVEGTPRSPEIVFDTEKGYLSFKGHSLPENTGEFYYPILEWVKNYIQDAPMETSVTFDLEYFNSSSFKMLLEMIQILSKLKIREKDLIVTWNYQEGDEDMFDSGKQLEELLDIKFEYICYK
jgi:hypothetical protein